MNQFEQRQAENYVSFDAAMPLTPAPKDVLPTTVNPDAPHWTSLAAFGMWILSIVLLLFLSALALGGYIATKGVSEINQASIEKDPTAIIVNLAAIFPAHLLTIFAVWMLVARGGRQSFWQTLGWKWNGFGFWACLGTTIALYAVGIAVISLMGEPENDLIRILQSSRTAVFLTAIMATFTAPLVEELVYRGVMYPAFKQTFGTGAAVFLVTFLFAAVHVPQYLPSYGTIIVITILSLVLTLIRAWTQSLLPCFVIHTLFNGIQALLLIAAPCLPKGEAPTVDPLPSFVVWLNYLR